MGKILSAPAVLIIILILFSSGQWICCGSSKTYEYSVNDIVKVSDDFYINRNHKRWNAPQLPITGNITIWVIYVEFQDVTHTIDDANASNMLNNVVLYFDEASLGQTNIQWLDIGGTIWLTLPNTMSYYGAPSDTDKDANYIDLIKDSISVSDPYIDYSRVDSLLIIHAGDDEASSGDPNDIWSFSISGGRWLTDEGLVKMNIAVGAETDPLGVVAHELGHVLWLPDLYDYSGQREFVGGWGLMGGGAWNGPFGSQGSYPAHLIGWSKMYLGWMEGRIYEVTLSSMLVELNITPHELADGIALVKINLPNGQYFLIEARKKTGYDAYLPGEGVLISLVDEERGGGEGIVTIIDSTPGDNDVDDGQWGVGTIYSNSTYNLTISVIGHQDDKYLIQIYIDYPTREATIESIYSTYGSSSIDLLAFKYTVLIHNYTPVYFNVSVLNSGEGSADGYFFIKVIYNDSVVVSTQAYIPFGSSYTWSIQADEIAFTSGFLKSRIEVWRNESDSPRLTDRFIFNITVIRYSYEISYSPGQIVQNQVSRLIINISNTGDMTIYNVSISILDADGLNIYPDHIAGGDVEVSTYTIFIFELSAPQDLAPGSRTIIIRINYVDFSGGSWDKTFELRIDVIQDALVIDKVYQSDDRASVGSNQTIGFHVIRLSDGKPVDGAIIYVNGTRHITDADGWAYLNVSWDNVALTKWVVTGAEYQNLTAFRVDVPPPMIIWDKLLVIDGWVSDDRTDVDDTVRIRFTVEYAYDGSVFQDGDVRINGISASYDDSDGSWWIDFSSAEVVSIEFMVTEITDRRYGLNVYEPSVAPLKVIWDEVNITIYTIDDRIDVGEAARIFFNATYMYDGSVFDGEIYLNDTLAHDEVGKWHYKVSAIHDPRYGLTRFTSNVLSIVWDMVILNLSVADDRVDVGQAVNIDVQGYYAYDGTPFEGHYVLNDIPLKESVGKYDFYVIEISDELYGLTRYEANPIDIIWDMVIVELGVVDSRVDVGSKADISVNAYYAYDKAVFEGDIFLNDSLVKDQVGQYSYKVRKIVDPLYGISMFTSNTVSVIFDKVIISVEVEDTRIDVGSSPQLHIDAYYAYDHKRFTGSITFNDSLVKNEAGRFTYAVSEIDDQIYGLTAFESDEFDIIYDYIIFNLSTIYGRVAVGATIEVHIEAFYAYDGTPFIGSYILNDSLTKLSVGRYSYSAVLVRDDLYNLTAYTSNSVSITFDDISYSIDVDTLRFASIKVVILLYYQYDKEPVTDAIIKVNSVEARQTEPGRYILDLGGFTLSTDIDVDIYVKGFGEIELSKSIVHMVHWLMIIASLSVILALALYTLSKRSRR